MTGRKRKPRRAHVGATQERVLLAVRQLAGEGGWAPTEAVVAHVLGGRLRVTAAMVLDAAFWLVRLDVLERSGPEQLRIARHG